MRNREFIAWKSLPFVALSLALTPVAAQNSSSTPVNEDGVVAVGGVSILTIRFPDAGMSVKQRADAVTMRLRAILADPAFKPSDIVAVPLDKNAAAIMVKNRLLVTVEPQMARFDSDTPMELAQTWVQHLRVVLPQVNVRPNPNLGEPVGNGK